MKANILSILSLSLLAFGSAQGAVTFSVANVTGSTFGPNGLPIVDGAGAAVAVNTIYASIGYFTSFPAANTSTTTATLLSTYVAVDTAGVTNTTNPGLFNGQDYSSATNVYPAGFQGQQGYLVVGNNVNVALSTAIAVFTLGTNFPAPAGDNTASYTIALTSDTSSLKYGTLLAVTTQPRIDTNPANNYLNGVQLQSSGFILPVPEPSAALLGALGALGLLRRRRI